MDRRDDNRSKKVIFVSSCLLNTNNKVKGLARYPGMCKEVFDTLYENDLGIQQMDCPETLYIGIQRWWHTKNLYDNLWDSADNAERLQSVRRTTWKSTEEKAIK